MEQKNIRRSARLKIQKEKAIALATLQECRSDMKVRDKKMAERKVAIKGKKGGRGGKYIKSKIVSQLEAGPSGLGQSQDKVVVEQTDFMVICRYKPRAVNLKPRKPYEVRWGYNYLKTLVPDPNRRSILKKSSVDRKMKPHLQFAQTTVYYFDKIIPYKAVPFIDIDMEPFHFYSNFIPVDEYESQKNIRNKRNLYAAIDDNYAIPKVIPSTNSNEEDIIVNDIKIPVELIDDDEEKNLFQKVTTSCSCNVYCDPDICECNLTGKKCEVFIDDFPCGCLLEYCRNPNGREAYNKEHIKKNAEAAIRASESKEIESGRVNKRKQPVPIRCRYKNFERKKM